MKKAKNIGLALSGGGVLGAAHVGIIQSLEKNDIEISLVSGTSAGAIVGVLYASGGLKTINEFYEDLGTTGIFQPHKIIQSSPAKLFDQLHKLLHKHVPQTSFDQLEKPFYCVATNIKNGKMTIFDKGNPVDCVMASAAYPGVFPAQIINREPYFDGGITCNFPVDILKKNKADFIIGSSIYGLRRLKPGQKVSLIFAASRALQIMEKTTSDEQAKLCNFCFIPPVNEHKWYDFHRLNEILEIGNNYAESKIPELLSKLNSK